jgi:hypothetical protein
MSFYCRIINTHNSASTESNFASCHLRSISKVSNGQGLLFLNLRHSILESILSSVLPIFHLISVCQGHNTYFREAG